MRGERATRRCLRGGGKAPWAFCCGILLLLLAFGGAGGGFPALAASGPADTLTLRSNEGLVYDDQAGQVVARGDVVITYRDYTLKAQEMRYDLRTHRMDLSGGAWLQQGDRRIQAESLTFQLDDESGRFFNFAGQVAAKGVKGPVYIRGRQLQILPKAETLQDASFTTCDLEHPHYHVQARKVIIYPDDRLEAWSVVYYQGKIPLLYWPYLVIPLRRDNRLGLPQVGYSERDGWYIRNTYNYYTHSGASGSLVLDYFQKAGWGGGARHNFRLGGDGPWSGQGTLYGYARQTGVSPLLDWQLEGSYDQGLGSQGSLKLALGRSQQQTGPGSAAQKDSQRLNLSWQGNQFRLSWTWDGQASASVATGSGTGGASAAGDTGTPLPAWAQGRDVTSQLQAQWQPWAGGKLLLDAGYQQRDGFDSPALWRLRYRVAVQQEWPGQTWELLREEVIQPLPGEEEVPWTSYAREPELRWTLRPVAGWPWQIEGKLGRYHEEPSGITAGRGSVQVGINGARVPLGWAGQVAWNPFLLYASYTTADHWLALNQTWTWQWEPLPGWSNTVAYVDRETLGQSPFTFDYLPTQETITAQGSAILFGRALAVTWSGGYTLQGSQPGWQDASLALGSGPDLPWKWQVATTWQGGTWNPKETQAGIQLEQGAWDAKGSVQYDWGSNVWKKVELSLSGPAGSLWRWSTTVAYDGVHQYLSQARISLVRDLHCQELTLSYDAVQRQVWAAVSIKAFPGQDIRFGRGPGDFLFQSNIDWSSLQSGGGNP